jgi:hypothetical protein
MHRGVLKETTQRNSRTKREKKREREREGRDSIAQGLLVFGFGESVGGKTGAVTWELLFAEWGNLVEGHDDLVATWSIWFL